MIDLPSFAIPSSMTPAFIDAGFVQRGVQSEDYIPRKGGRYQISFRFGPYQPDRARVMIARLIAGKQGGLRVKLPVLHDQAVSGTPQLNGAVTSGRTIAIDGLTPGTVLQEGFWLSLVKDGRHYLHSVGIGGTANGSGQVSVELNELLRDTFPDNAAVHIVEPQVEGLIEGDEASWVVPVERLVGIEFTLKEVR